MSLHPGSFGEYGEIELTQSKYVTKERHDLLNLLPQDFNCLSILDINDLRF